jgi:hypothetical protein
MEGMPQIVVKADRHSSIKSKGIGEKEAGGEMKTRASGPNQPPTLLRTPSDRAGRPYRVTVLYARGGNVSLGRGNVFIS